MDMVAGIPIAVLLAGGWALAADPTSRLTTQAAAGGAITWVTTFHSHVTSRDGSKTWLRTEDRRMAYQSPGLYRETYLDLDGKERGYNITDAVQKLELAIMPAKRQAKLSELAVVMRDPRGPFAWCYEDMNKPEVKQVGTRQAGGREVEVLRHAMWDASNGRNWSYDFWVDAVTKQIVEVHVPGADIYDATKDETRRNAPEEVRGTITPLGFVEHDIVYDAEVDASLFRFEAPAGYHLERVGRQQITEREMVDYLSILAEFNDNTFPDQVMPFDISSDRVSAVWKKAEGQRTPAEKKYLEAQRHYMEVGLNAMPIGHFVEDHVVPGTFTYLGKGAKLGDKGRVVCWYQVKGENDYRVIRADMSMENVPQERLAAPRSPEREVSARDLPATPGTTSTAPL